MRLCSELYGPQSSAGVERPTLVFLHGLLGSGRDWQRVISSLSSHYPCVTLDLPGHGGSRHVTAQDFQHTQTLIADSLADLGIHQIILIGYSLGARLAMQIACQPVPAWQCQIKSLFIEGGNFGLASEQERAQRWQHDLRWAERFSTESLAKVLTDWYQQAVFASLSSVQRADIIARRLGDNSDENTEYGPEIGAMLTATSLAKQPYLLDELQQLTYPVRYICGAGDEKFRRLAQNSQLDHQVVEQAGHNVHSEQPKQFSVLLSKFLDNFNDKWIR